VFKRLLIKEVHVGEFFSQLSAKFHHEKKVGECDFSQQKCQDQSTKTEIFQVTRRGGAHRRNLSHGLELEENQMGFWKKSPGRDLRARVQAHANPLRS